MEYKYIVYVNPDPSNVGIGTTPSKIEMVLVDATKEQCDAKIEELINSGISTNRIEYFPYPPISPTGEVASEDNDWNLYYTP